MTTTFTYPESAELRAIAQTKIPRLMRNRPIFDLMPIREVNDHVVMWEQADNFTGLQQVRGLNGEPPHVKRTGLKRYTMLPGAYGEYSLIDEAELTRRRTMGTFDTPIDIADLVTMEDERLLGRELDRIELIGWTLFITGTFSVTGPSGAVLHTDSFTTQTYSAGVAWSTAATSTPLANFRAVQLLSRGYSVSFGRNAKAYMNRTTANSLLVNTNAADIFGRRVTGLATANSIDQFNTILAGEDLPQIVIYDEGYLDDSGTFQLFIPNSKVLVAGARTDGSPIAEYVMTRNANNSGMAPGSYQRVVDDADRIPRRIECHRGHNGGPALLYGSAFVVMSV